MTGNDRRDFSGIRIEDLDFSGSHLHGPSFEEATITDAFLCGAVVSGYIEGLILNGVEVAPLVEAELDRRQPERIKLRSTDPAGLAEGWAMVDARWRQTVARAKALPEPLTRERVNHEWSFVETLRHMVMAIDCWLMRMIRRQERAYHPWALAGSWLTEHLEWGIDPDAGPSVEEVLPVFWQHMAAVTETMAGLTPAELDRECVPPDTPGHPVTPHTVLHCLHVILNEGWLHDSYAERDLAVLEGRTQPGRSPV
jgi:hypothetical protein